MPPQRLFSPCFCLLWWMFMIFFHFFFRRLIPAADVSPPFARCLIFSPSRSQRRFSPQSDPASPQDCWSAAAMLISMSSRQSAEIIVRFVFSPRHAPYLPILLSDARYLFWYSDACGSAPLLSPRSTAQFLRVRHQSSAAEQRDNQEIAENASQAAVGSARLPPETWGTSSAEYFILARKQIFSTLFAIFLPPLFIIIFAGSGIACSAQVCVCAAQCRPRVYARSAWNMVNAYSRMQKLYSVMRRRSGGAQNG